jgi:hypothetical protein
MNQSPSVVATTAIGASSTTSSTMKRAVRKKALKLREFERIDSISDEMRPVIDDVLARTDAQAAGKEAA